MLGLLEVVERKKKGIKVDEEEIILEVYKCK